jgi:hypothetical protein
MRRLTRAGPGQHASADWQGFLQPLSRPSGRLTNVWLRSERRLIEFASLFSAGKSIESVPSFGTYCELMGFRLDSM